MASIKETRRVALYDNSRKDTDGSVLYKRIAWDLVTLTPGAGGAASTTFFEPISVGVELSPNDAKTSVLNYHRLECVDPSALYDFVQVRPNCGTNRADE